MIICVICDNSWLHAGHLVGLNFCLVDSLKAETTVGPLTVCVCRIEWRWRQHQSRSWNVFQNNAHGWKVRGFEQNHQATTPHLLPGVPDARKEQRKWQCLAFFRTWTRRVVTATRVCGFYDCCALAVDPKLKSFYLFRYGANLSTLHVASVVWHAEWLSEKNEVLTNII